MTAAQFAALADLMSLRAGPARDAARAVLVDGLTQATAAAQTGASRQSVSQAVGRCQRALELARVAACGGPISQSAI